MSRIKGHDTSPEIVLRRELWRAGLRYRKQHRLGRVRPDLVFLGPRVAIFIDGCFWHGCPDHYVRPRSRGDFWAKKLRDNVERDRRQTLQLEREGWTVLRFWEHEVLTDCVACVEAVRRALTGDCVRPESWRVIKVEALAEDQGRPIERRVLEELRDATKFREESRRRTTTKW